MLPHEKFMLDSFPKVFGKHFGEILDSDQTSIDEASKKAVHFLESECNGKYGFFSEAHNDVDMSRSNSYFKIPTSFDSAFLLPYIMNNGVDQLTVNNLISVLKRSRRSSGFWNFFFDPENKSHSLVPDDVDDTALAALVLFNTGNLSMNECRSLVKLIGKHRLVDPKTNAITTWIPDHKRKIVFTRYQDVPKLCVGVLTNLLWFLASICMETEQEFIPSIDYVHSFVDDLIMNKGNDDLQLPAMCYYTNKHLHFFFIARFIQKSAYAQEKFGKKFVHLLLSEFRFFVAKPNSEALDIASMILAIWHLSLHKIGEQNWVRDETEIREIRENIKKLCDRLLTLQDKDGSYRAWKVYKWNKIGHWGGSKILTTGLVLAVLRIVQRDINDNNSF